MSIPFTPYPLTVGASPIHRQGCFAGGLIPPGARICEYVGERIDAAEAVRREADPGRPGIYTVWVTDDLVVDGWVGGNASIYLNHCCTPNCEWEFDADRVYIRALAPIAAGEELTIDYAYSPDPPLEPCACGSAACRGTLNWLGEGA